MISSGVSRASRVKSPATASNSRNRASAASWADPTPPAGWPGQQAAGLAVAGMVQFHAAQHLRPGPVRRGAVTPPAHAAQHARAAVGSATRHFREHRGLADAWLAGDKEQLTCARQHLGRGRPRRHQEPPHDRRAHRRVPRRPLLRPSGPQL